MMKVNDKSSQFLGLNRRKNRCIFCLITFFGFLICFEESQAINASIEDQIEVFPSLSFLQADSLRASFLGGLSVNWLVNESFWLGLDFYTGKGNTDDPTPLNLQDDRRLYMTDLAAYWNIPIFRKESLNRKWADLYASVGGGHLWLGPQKSMMGFVGGGLVVHTHWHNLAAHFDLKNIFYSLKNSAGNDFNSDMSLSLGPSLIF